MIGCACMKRIGVLDGRRRHARPQRDDARRGGAGQPVQGRGDRLHQGFQQPVQSARAARAAQSAVHDDPRARPDPRRHDHRRLARLCRSDDRGDDRGNRRPHAAAADRGPDLHRRRWHAERHAGLVGLFPDRAGAQDDRQRPGPQLSPRARRVAARAVRVAARLPLRPQPRRAAGSSSTR